MNPEARDATRPNLKLNLHDFVVLEYSYVRLTTD